ncbi:MAG: hypothetical protein IPK26_13160 [Planctomycetes bacterium]|nr:hypothetical protein [Planctomycetota bacterium]
MVEGATFHDLENEGILLPNAAWGVFDYRLTLRRRAAATMRLDFQFVDPRAQRAQVGYCLYPRKWSKELRESAMGAQAAFKACEATPAPQVSLTFGRDYVLYPYVEHRGEWRSGAPIRVDGASLPAALAVPVRLPTYSRVQVTRAGAGGEVPAVGMEVHLVEPEGSVAPTAASPVVADREFHRGDCSLFHDAVWRSVASGKTDAQGTVELGGVLTDASQVLVSGDTVVVVRRSTKAQQAIALGR